MIQEAYVSYEIAQLLKKKGFNVPCNSWYMYCGDGSVKKFMLAEPVNHNQYDGFPLTVSRPTHQMACAWLREHGLHINANISYDYSVDADGNEVDRWTFWLFEILSSFNGNLIYTEEVNQYDSYEEAVESAIKYSLENLL